jgi:large subunit ribosomal protein LP0
MERKKTYFNTLANYCDEYKKILLVGADNVTSKQMQNIRIALRGKASVLMGKNTMMTKAIRTILTKHPKLEKVLPHVKENIGFIFTNEEPATIRAILDANKVSAPARQGAISPVAVVIPAGPTPMEPTKTSFFQALSIATKITKGAIEIIADVHLLKVGDKVGSSEATLLQMLKIKPFFYGMNIFQIYDDGVVFEPSVLDLTEEDIVRKFSEGISNIAALSLAISYPTQASIPHLLAGAIKNVIAISVATDIEVAAAQKIKAYIADPSAFAVAAAPVASSSAAPAAASKPVVEEKPESEEEMGFGGLF